MPPPPLTFRIIQPGTGVTAAGEGEEPSADGSPPGIGKSAGGLFGEGHLLLLRVMTLDSFDNSCMELIGQGAKFCSIPTGSCNTIKHRHDKFSLQPSTMSPSGTYAFIKIKPNVLSTALYIPIKALVQPIRSTLESECRTFDEWEATFHHLTHQWQQGITLDEDSLTTIFASSKHLGPPLSLLEPSTKKLRKEGILARVQTSYLPITPSEFQLNKEAQLGNLEQNFTALLELVKDNRAKLLQNAIQLEEMDLSAVDLQLLAIKNIISKQNENTDPRSVIETLEHLLHEIEQLRFTALSSSDKEKNLPLESSQEGVQNSIKFITDWFKEHSDPSSAAGKLLKRIDALENSTSQLVPGLDRLQLNQPQTGTQNMIKSLVVQISKTEDLLKALREEKSTKTVTLVNTTFQTRTGVKAWLLAHAATSQGYLHFVDLHSLLALTFNSQKGTDKDVVTFQLSTLKSGYESTEAALVVKSFNYALPQVFSSGKNLSDPMLLGAITTWDSFEGVSVMDRFWHEFERDLKDVVKTLSTEVYSDISIEGQSLALTCIRDSHSFCISNPESATGVQAIFEHLHQQACKVRRGADKSFVTWGCLQGRLAAHEFTLKGFFSEQSLVQNVLNEHMQDKAVMREEFLSLMTKMQSKYTKLETEFQSLKGKADKAQEKAKPSPPKIPLATPLWSHKKGELNSAKGVLNWNNKFNRVKVPHLYKRDQWILQNLTTKELALCLDFLGNQVSACSQDIILDLLKTEVPGKVLSGSLTFLQGNPPTCSPQTPSHDSGPSGLSPAKLRRLNFVDPQPTPVRMNEDTELVNTVSDEAVKADNASVPEYLWNHRIAKKLMQHWKSIQLLAMSQAGPIPGKPPLQLHEALDRLRFKWALKQIRSFCLAFWKCKVKRDFLTWFQAQGLDHSKDKEIFLNGLAARQKANKARWWNWDNGSSTFFWRWPSNYQTIARKGITPMFNSDSPKNQDLQPPCDDDGTRAMMKDKLDNVIGKGYIQIVDIKSLEAMMFMFHIPKRLNAALHSPWFALPTVNTMIRSTLAGSWLADNNYGEQFLDFPLHPDLNTASKGPPTVGVWMRNTMGLKLSPYNSVQGSLQAKQLVLGDPLDSYNPYSWSNICLNLPGTPDYDPRQPWIYKLRHGGLSASEICQYIDDVWIITATEEIAWRCSSQMAKGCLSWLGLQEAARKRMEASQQPGAWAGATICTNEDFVNKGETKDPWEKVKVRVRRIANQLGLCGRHSPGSFGYLEEKASQGKP
eukprot:jgi/Psemu1/3728/gm1.3728_g